MRSSLLLVLVMMVLATMSEAASIRSEAESLLADKEGGYPYRCLAFRTVGYGFCRERTNHWGSPYGTGDYKLYRNIWSKYQCANLCFYTHGCTGYEYDERSHRHTCEVHTGRVGAYKPKYGVVCYEAYQTYNHNNCYYPVWAKSKNAGSEDSEELTAENSEEPKAEDIDDSGSSSEESFDKN
ncbi:Hypothetical Protein FCC1311_005522 [Hondaea fermentalgiana]|uniref:Apple domain-containing protein n=1 Tax=Hondaea fermentalgiana TaxID=2315210 RepID=A0A2R5G9H8_9STRA|nr:Hypothetical Protein FCC1311_005522 [Hondaea fermentalgiana]|eukprot:GBG24334.1 Hypothetical Protein FCC1311_005522 [Hondaea fermentalgiana]